VEVLNVAADKNHPGQTVEEIWFEPIVVKAVMLFIQE